MKNLLVLCLLISASQSYANEKLIALDMDLGYWETTTEIQESPMIRDMLSALPESQQGAIRDMMAQNIPDAVKQCVTEDTFKNMEQQIKETLGSNQGTEGCELKVVESTSQTFKGELNCAGNPIKVHTKVINSKRHESVVLMSMAGLGENKIRTIGEWKSATCPEGL